MRLGMLRLRLMRLMLQLLGQRLLQLCARLLPRCAPHLHRLPLQVRTADDWRQKALQDPNEAAYVLSLPGSGGPTTSRASSMQQQQQQQQLLPPAPPPIYQLPPGFDDGRYQVVAPQYQTVLPGGEQYALYAAPPGLLYQQPQHDSTSPGRRAGGPGDVAQLTVDAAGLSLAEPGLEPVLYQGGPQVVGRLPAGQQFVGSSGALLLQPGQQYLLQGPQQQQQQPLMVMLPNGQLVQLQQGLQQQ
jgi:hypothetical protein